MVKSMNRLIVLYTGIACISNKIQVANSFVISPLQPSSSKTWGKVNINIISSDQNHSLKSRLIKSSHLITRKSTTSSSSPNTSSVEETLTPIPEEWRGEVLKELSTVIDPDLNRDIVTLGFIKELSLDPTTRTVSFSVELTTPACPIKEEFQTQCEQLVLNLPWTQNAQITMTAAEPPPMDASGQTPYGLSGVSSIIAVSSCKGGVGKSTTAVNLAYALQSLGATVGIFDADVYGPSLPTMIKPDNDNVLFVGRQISPLQRNGVRLMSFGYVNDGAAIMRGPMITQLLDQILSLTYWGQLDYLILDMPPGTGDIQLTLSQRLNITAAVVVTTPQELSFVDVERGVDMFQEVNVPCVAVVENMAYIDMEKQPRDKSEAILDTETLKSAFIEKIQSDIKQLDPKSVQNLADELVSLVHEQQKQEQATSSSNDNEEDSQFRIFGPGHKNRLSKEWGIEHIFSIPLLQNIAETGDSGTPFILQHPDSPQADIFYDLASAVVMEVSKLMYSNSNAPPSLSFDSDRHLIEIRETTNTAQTNDGGNIDELIPSDLRKECKCALCVEELTGRQLLKPQDVPDSIKPINISPCGNYAVSVDWSDGHRSLYPYKQIRALIEEKRKSKSSSMSE